MGGSEGVVDEDVAQPGQRARRSRGRWPPLRRESARSRAARRRPRPSAFDRVFGGRRRCSPLANAHGAPSNSAVRAATGCSEYFGIGLAVRPTQVREQDDPGAVLAQVLEGRQGGANARVVGHLAVLHRHVEVDADQGGLAAPVHVANGAEAAPSPYCLRARPRERCAPRARGRRRSPSGSRRWPSVAVPLRWRATNAVMSDSRQA